MHKSVTPGFARLAKVFVIGLFVMAMAIGGLRANAKHHRNDPGNRLG